jgi:hypothetical protein|tara:strand:+ start:82 stop:405 length:324 start_codon:yes stop_codon:yes gene_type:complete
MYYVEFFRKKSNVSWETFRSVVEGGYKRWVELHPEDAPVLAIGRTWRLGPPDSSYMIVYRIRDFAQLDEWTKSRSSDSDSEKAIMEGTLAVADMDSGVYEDIGMELP